MQRIVSRYIQVKVSSDEQEKHFTDFIKKNPYNRICYIPSGSVA